jgi:hypothetical protein
MVKRNGNHAKGIVLNVVIVLDAVGVEGIKFVLI